MYSILEAIKHTLHDTWFMLIFLFIMYSLLEQIERRFNKDEPILLGLQKWGPLLGSFVGLLPQCGFSLLAAILYVQKNITMGTLVSVFIATSDEAIPILLSNPEQAPILGKLLLIKWIVAIIVGYLIDFVLERHQHIEIIPEIEEDDFDDTEDEGSMSSCPCCYSEYPWYVSAALRSLKIFAFIFITTFILTLIIEGKGEDILTNILLTGHSSQIFLAALIGFIPNCAATVILSQLYVLGQLSFASLCAGLITNAGLGLMVLFGYQANKKAIIKIVVYLFLTAILTGSILLI